MMAAALETALDGLACVVCVLWGFVWLVHLIALLCVGRARCCSAHSAQAQPPLTSGAGSGAARWPGLTVLKPLVGADADLEARLRSFFELSYPGELELVFCIQRRDDPAVAVVERLQAEYDCGQRRPVASRLSVGTAAVGINPKVNNIAAAYAAAAHDLVWINDAGLVAPDPETPRELVATAVRAGAGLSVVHQLPTVAAGTTLGDAIEQLYFGTKHARWYLFFDLLTLNCVNGMSIVFRRSALAAVGGLEPFGAHIAEDYYMTQALYDTGLRPRLSAPPAVQRAPPRGTAAVYTRHLRWTRLRQGFLPAAVAGELLLECFVIGPAAAWAAQRLSPAAAAAGWPWLLAAHLALWFASDLCLLSAFHPRRHQPAWPRYVAAWLTRELGELVMFGHAIAGSEVTWRGNTFDAGS